MKTAILLLGIFISSVSFAQSANPNDLKQARQLVSQLPPACSESSISTKTDGTVVIFINCVGNSKTPGTRGIIEIKDGVVRKIK